MQETTYLMYATAKNMQLLSEKKGNKARQIYNIMHNDYVLL